MPVANLMACTWRFYDPEVRLVSRKGGAKVALLRPFVVVSYALRDLAFPIPIDYTSTQPRRVAAQALKFRPVMGSHMRLLALSLAALFSNITPLCVMIRHGRSASE